jgi:hypothetical protein
MFVKFQKANIAFLCLSAIHMKQLSSKWTDFHEFYTLSIVFFENMLRKVKFIKIQQE